MLRQPGSAYEAGRSATLLKVKSFQRRRGGGRSGTRPGTGRHKGRLGALPVRLADGTRVLRRHGFQDRERGAPPAVGATVHVSLPGTLATGACRGFPSFHRGAGRRLTSHAWSG